MMRDPMEGPWLRAEFTLSNPRGEAPRMRISGLLHFRTGGHRPGLSVTGLSFRTTSWASAPDGIYFGLARWLRRFALISTSTGSGRPFQKSSRMRSSAICVTVAGIELAVRYHPLEHHALRGRPRLRSNISSSPLQAVTGGAAYVSEIRRRRFCPAFTGEKEITTTCAAASAGSPASTFTFAAASSAPVVIFVASFSPVSST